VRDVTFVAHEFLKLNVIIECNASKDFYYKFLKTFGVTDFIDDFLPFGIEAGMRIDKEFNLSPTVYVTDIINIFNLQLILKSIGFNGFHYY
jgi:hypothetical protein